MHEGKKGTPTMGGVLILISVLIPALLWCNLANLMVWIVLGVSIVFCAIGFLDDYLKVTKRDAGGLASRWKFLATIAISALAGWLLMTYGRASYAWFEGGIGYGPIIGFDHLAFPFFKEWYPQLGWLFLAWVVLVLTASSHAVNLTDGLDGLCIGITTIVAIAFALIAYLVSNRIYASHLMIPHVPQADEVVVLMGAVVGACLGFLWFNSYPAEIFMGDTGSLFLGGIIGTVAVLTKQEVLLVIIGGIYVIEALSVMIQVISYKRYKKRVFLMAPIHHHFERLGIRESKIITRFWIVTALLAMIGLATLKLR
jgi:phospho-N-acetylmuramoyl-pentapeptide-transferase